MHQPSDRKIEFKTIPETLVEVLSWRAALEPNRIAFVYLADGESEELSITYGELQGRAKAIAANLQQELTVGERALLIYPPGLEFLAAFFGCLYAGVIAVPVYPPRKDKDLIRILGVIQNAGTAVALTTSAIFGRLNAVIQGVDIPELNAMQWQTTDVTSELGALISSWQPPQISGDDIAFLQYTSGSTSAPKGVMVSHGNLIYNQRMIEPSTAHTKDCILVTWLPLYHDMGLIGNILHPLYIGFKCIFMSPEVFLQKPFRWLQAITRYKATTTGGAPNFALELCLNRITSKQLEQLDLSSWKLAIIGSDAVRHSTLERFYDRFAPCGFRLETFYPAYGLAEATLIVSGGIREEPPHYISLDAEALKHHRVTEVPRHHKDSQILVGCGRTWLDQRIVVVDPEQEIECPPNRIGEIWVSGKNVAKGYWNNEEDTKALLQARLPNYESRTFLRTGDLGFIRDGELYITGRLKNMIIIRGRNYYPQDIEATVEQEVDALRAGCSAAFTVEKDGGEKLVLVAELERRFISERRHLDIKKPEDKRSQGDRRAFNPEDIGISEPDSDLDFAACLEQIKQSIAENHGLQAHAVVLIRPVSLPKTTSGKIRHLECRRQFLNNELIVVEQWLEPEPTADSVDAPEGFVPTASTIQSWLISRLSSEFKLPRHQLDTRVELTRYGLDSLGAVGVSGELEEWLGRPVSPTLFYNFPTIRAIAEHLGKTDQDTIQVESSSPMTYDVSTPVAIIGAACRLPGSRTLIDFWEFLLNATDAIGELPLDRREFQAHPLYREQKGKSAINQGAFLREIDRFDPLFFGITPREATFMDPQQRILLEVSWEAFENAGLPVIELAGTKTGVFVGISNNDYGRLTLSGQNDLNVYQGTGNALSIASNRISYQYDLRGPSISVDTACSSSLVAVHLACQSLRNGESNLAVAGGVNLILSPETTVIFSRAGMLADDGRCKTFDDAADGYVRGEGCGLIVLKRLSDAINDGDNVMAVIRGSAVNQDGRSNGITAPSGLAQQSVILQALQNAGVTADQIGYVEAHGTGTSLGDPIEMDALKSVLMKNRSQDNPCFIGSVKTNVGHLESAAGITGLLKTVLSIQQGQIPAHLHFKMLNPHISLEHTSLKIPTSTQPWPSVKGKKLAGVSSFGFGGTNAHIILEEAVPPQSDINGRPAANALQPFTLSAKNRKTLTALARRHVNWLTSTVPTSDQWVHICYSANRGRSHFSKRLCVLADSPAHLRESLSSFIENKPSPYLMTGDSHHEKAARLTFLFPHPSEIHPEAVGALYSSQPVFKTAFDACATAAHPFLGTSLTTLLQSDESGMSTPAVALDLFWFTVDYALARLWMSWGAEPDFLLGEGVGEFSAACLAGVCSLNDAVKLLVEKAHLQQTSDREHNLKRFKTLLAGIPFSQPGIPMVFCDEGKPAARATDLSAEYWLSRMEKQAQTGIVDLSGMYADLGIFIELGPASLSKRITLPESAQPPLMLHSLDGQEDNWPLLLEGISTLYLHGIDFCWKEFYRGYGPLRHVALPNYPFQPKRYWIDTPEIQKASACDYTGCLYDIRWLEKAREFDGADSEQNQEGYWLIFADEGQAGAELRSRLNQQGDQVILVFAHSQYQVLDTQTYRIDPTQPDHFARLFTGLTNSGTCLGMVHLWSLNRFSEPELSLASVQQSINLGSLSTLHLAQAILQQNRLPVEGIWLVTRNAQAVDSSDTDIEAEQSLLWGFGKGIAVEHPELNIRLLDLDEKPAGESAADILYELRGQTTDWQVALRGQRRLVARLYRSEKPQVPAEDGFSWRSDSTYLITGGTGRLGIKVAEFIAEQGVTQIALISRSPVSKKSDSHEEGDRSPAAIIQSLQEKGVTVKTFQADVSNRSAMEEVFREIAQSMPEIRGVFHAAGTVSRSAITALTRQEFEAVLQAKVYGTLNLHQLTLSLNLDCFVLFSSISSVWGSKGIGHYAAANAFLDGFAHYRKWQHLPALSINWGPWSNGGMTTKAEQTQLSRIGILPLEPVMALNILNLLLQSGDTVKVVCDIIWRRLQPLYNTIGYGSLFESIEPLKTEQAARPLKLKTEAVQVHETKPWARELAHRSNAEKQAYLIERLKEELATVMGCQPQDISAEAGFFEMGMDSLMAVELKDTIEEQLGRALEATLIFDYPNLTLLANFLVQEPANSLKTPIQATTPADLDKTPQAFAAQVSQTARADPEEPVIRKDAPDLDGLSEEDITRLIEKELEDI